MSSLTSSYAGALILASMAALGAAYLGNKVAGDSAPAPEPTPLPSLDTPAPLAITDGAAPVVPAAPDSSVSEEDARRKLIPLVKADGADAILKFIKTPVSQWKTVAPSTFKLTLLVSKSYTHPDKCPAALVRICALVFNKYSQMSKASKGEPYDDIGNEWTKLADLIDELPEPPADAAVVPEPPAADAAPAAPAAPVPEPPVVPEPPAAPATPAVPVPEPPAEPAAPALESRFPTVATIDRPWLSGVPSTHGPAVQEGPVLGNPPNIDVSQEEDLSTPENLSPAGPDRPWLQPLDARLQPPPPAAPPLPAISIANQRGSVLAKSGRNTLGRVQAFVPLTPPDTPPGTPPNELETILTNNGQRPLGQLKEEEVRTARPTIGELTNANAEAKATELAAYIKANPSQRASVINEFTSALESAMHAGRVTAATQTAVRALVGASRRRREG